MKFTFDKDRYCDLGLVLKHGNRDNIVLFFDEIEDATIYRAKLFRTEVEFEIEGSLREVELISQEVEYRLGRYVEFNGCRRKEEYKETIENTCIKRPVGKMFPAIYDGKICQEVKREIIDYRDCIRTILSIQYTDLDQIKYITSVESNRNDLYINIDFLPCGFYFVCLEAEDRNGAIINTAAPYYFKVNETSNKEILNAINGVNETSNKEILNAINGVRRAAARPVVRNE